MRNNRVSRAATKPWISPAGVLIAACCAAAMLDSFPRSARAEERPKGERLFDGVTLEGWQGDPVHWHVESGSIVGSIPPGKTLNKNTWLVYRGGELNDFELNLKFRLTGLPAANSGIQIRCQVENVDHVSGYQADLDMGSTWLGRIYDEHGRALLVERGVRVHIAPDGKRRQQTFAPLHQFPVLVRENQWNDYRIVAIGERIDVYVNGSLFSSLWDQQAGERDLSGSLALQLHSGPETRIEFKDLWLETLQASDSDRLTAMDFGNDEAVPSQEKEGLVPKDAQGEKLNLGLETGSLDGWQATGTAFRGQPVKVDGISQRWPGQVSNKVGDYFIGGYELEKDAAVGTLQSPWFRVTHPYAGFLLSGGEAGSTRVEILRYQSETEPPVVHAQAVGNNREQMRRVAIGLRSIQDAMIAVRLVDENAGGWGHLNFDDFRFYDAPPVAIEPDTSKRTTFNAILHTLRPNAVGNDVITGSEQDQRAAQATLGSMFVPPGFSVDAIASEPRVHQPIAFAWDSRGRLWVVEAHSYPQKRPPGEGLDRIVILEDADANGSFESRKVFTEGLNLASGIEVGYGGVWIGAAPELLFIPDRDGDDRPDSEPVVLLDGFGFGDTHETLNSFLWGPDGWLYGTQGVFNTSSIGKPGAESKDRKYLAAGVWRYHPTRNVFEVFAYGGSNPWGLDYDMHGQLFMTHCRSFWGRGGTTHVMLGGHYWNQVNGGYAPFISSNGLRNHPHLQNFLLASARYDSGEGGAGKPGTGDVYGGHSHVGTMIYLGDNWPSEYRNHLLTHNLHGHQLNHQINRREAGGYNSIHAGKDLLFCSDPQFIGVDLMLGPDGAVYMTDWYDPRLCHNPNDEQWDRGNGRIYRMKYDANYKPAHVDYRRASDWELVAAQQHPNDWHARAARLELATRYAAKPLPRNIVAELQNAASAGDSDHDRLRAIWTLIATGTFSLDFGKQLLRDPNEFVRAWAVQALTEHALDASASMVIELAESEPSLFVRRYLASAMTRLDPDQAWVLGSKLALQSENEVDRDLPVMIWQGLASHWDGNEARALELAQKTELPVVRDSILWFAAKNSLDGREKIAAAIGAADPSEQKKLLELFEYALRGTRVAEAPRNWEAIADSLYQSSDMELRRAAEQIGAQVLDHSLFDRMREQLRSTESLPQKLHAISLLAFDNQPDNVQVLLDQLDRPELALKALPLLRQYDSERIGQSVLGRLKDWNGELSAAAMELLSSRTIWASQLLDAIEREHLDKDRLTAFYARQISQLGDDKLSESLARVWGQVRPSSEQLREEIRKTAEAYKAAPLWAYDGNAGRAHFQKLCASCHSLEKGAVEFAPKLQGTGAKGADYAVENVIDPNAVIGRDYQARVIRTNDGQVITGLVVRESDASIEIRTTTDTLLIDKDSMEEIRVSENSFMPVGLLETLDERQRIELLKYVLSL